MLQPRFLLLGGMIFAAALMRLIPHPPNFAPIGAMALFGGAHFASKRWSFVVPLSAMLFSDVILYLTKYPSHLAGLPGSLAFVYGSFVLIVCLGFWLRKNRKLRHIAAATLAGSILFFLITNFGTWLMWDMYPKTLSGLIACYAAAIPFFPKDVALGSPLLNTVLGDAFYVTALFGAFALAERRIPVLQSRPVSHHAA